MKITRAIIQSVYLLMPIAIIMAFLLAPAADLLGEYSRIVYFHVPLAWVSVLAFGVSGVLSILHLARRKSIRFGLDEQASNSAAIGLACTLLTLISGSIWAKLSWGSFWNWDPRQTSIIFILLIYIAYFCLRAALADGVNRANIGSSYLVVAMMTLPFFVFIAPRVTDSLHPDTIINVERKIHMDWPMLITLIASLVAFSMLYAYLLHLMNRIAALRNSIEEHAHVHD